MWFKQAWVDVTISNSLFSNNLGLIESADMYIDRLTSLIVENTIFQDFSGPTYNNIGQSIYLYQQSYADWTPSFDNVTIN